MDNYKSMFEQSVRTLATIDESLGVGDDGCADPEQTLDAIAELKADAETAWAQAKRLAMELECVLMDCKDQSVVARWWDSAHEALDEFRQMTDGGHEHYVSGFGKD